MLDTLAALPFWQAFIALFAIVLARSNATYWVGRGAVAGWRRRRPSRESTASTESAEFIESVGPAESLELAESEGRARAETLLRRFGPLAVVLSYLTVGIQTTIHLTAGLMRMPLAFYVPAAVIGSMLWAVLYATIGIAVVQAWLAAEAGSWLGATVLAVLAVAGLTVWLRSRRRGPGDAPDPAQPAAAEGTEA